MDELPLDRIHIRDLGTRCIIGVNDDERVNLQDVVINITLHADLRMACASDAIEDTIDYKNIKVSVLEEVEGSSYFLIERLAERIAELCLVDGVERVDVSVDKPGALRFAESVAVEISRQRESS
jgi:FolB domain-containing protein